MRPLPTTCLALISCLALAPLADAQAPKLPGPNSPAREAARKYHLSMNMLLFPDYFLTEEQFRAMAKDGFADANVPALVRGLGEYGFQTRTPKSAEEYRTLVYPKLLDFLKECGYYAIEIPVGGARLDLCPKLREELESRGFVVTAVGGSGADLVGSLKQRVDAAHALGARIVAGPVVLPFKVYPEEIGDARVAWVKKKLESLVGPMREAAEYAKSKDVRLAVEPLNRFELPGMNRLGQAIEFVKAVDHPNFGVMIDTCHEMSDGEGPKKFREQVQTLTEMGKLFHVHISAIHRGRIDDAWIQWGQFFAPLLESGYRGNMSMEIFDSTLPFSEVVHINRPRFDNPAEVALSALLHSARQLQWVEKDAAQK